MAQTMYVHFHVNLSDNQKDKIIQYLQSFPSLFWRKNINVNQDSKTGLFSITDGQIKHEVYEHECRAC